ncbi:Gti1/Pac2 family-domain-containing protein [Chytriomyces sp. MP71]|nr:Gti1/Pac2 family-domain-containing protein [Chytriomyces sp. MP71]
MTTHQRPLLTSLCETYFGFLETAADADLIVEAVVAGRLLAVSAMPLVGSGISVRSGSICVYQDRAEQSQQIRWRDAFCWSASRMNGHFLLYREIEPSEKQLKKTVAGHHPYSRQRDASNPSAGLVSATPPPHSGTRHCKINLFSTSSLRKGTRLVPNGFAKRTILVTGSNGIKYRCVSYFYPSDVEHLYNEVMDPPAYALQTPSQDPNFPNLSMRAALLKQRHQRESTASPPSPPNSLHSPSPKEVNPTRLQTKSSCACGSSHLNLKLQYASLQSNPKWFNQPISLNPLHNL